MFDLQYQVAISNLSLKMNINIYEYGVKILIISLNISEHGTVLHLWLSVRIWWLLFKLNAFNFTDFKLVFTFILIFCSSWYGRKHTTNLCLVTGWLQRKMEEILTEEAFFDQPEMLPVNISTFMNDFRPIRSDSCLLDSLKKHPKFPVIESFLAASSKIVQRVGEIFSTFIYICLVVGSSIHSFIYSIRHTFIHSFAHSFMCTLPPIPSH